MPRLATPTDVQIGRRISAERKALRWSVAEMSRRTRISTGSLILAEEGCGRLSAFQLYRTLKALERKPVWLFRGLKFE